jgi:hypothetical protein
LKREKHETARNTRKAEAQSGLWCFGISMPKRACGLICVSSVFRHFNAETGVRPDLRFIGVSAFQCRKARGPICVSLPAC